MIAYRYARFYCINGIKATDYIDLTDEFPSDPEHNVEKWDIIFEFYMKNTLDYDESTIDIQRIIYISGYCLYVAVIYAPIGILSFYISFPKWFVFVIVAAPMILPLAFAKLAGVFGKSGGVIVKPKESAEKEVE